MPLPAPPRRAVVRPTAPAIMRWRSRWRAQELWRMGFRAAWVETGLGPLRLWRRQGPAGHSAPTWLFVHGFADEATGWTPLLRRLADLLGEQVALDLPGHGQSPLPVPSPSLEEVGSALEVATRHALGEGGEVVLVGSSMGGAGALRLAVALGHRVRGMVLISPAGAPMSPAELAAVLDLFTLDSLAKARRLVAELVDVPPWLLDVFARTVRAHLSQPSLVALRHLFGQMAWLTPGELAAMPPTLLLWGQRDRILPASGLAYLRAHLPAATTEVDTPAAWGHVPFADRPAEVAARIRAWLSARGELLPAARQRPPRSA